MSRLESDRHARARLAHVLAAPVLDGSIGLHCLCIAYLATEEEGGQLALLEGAYFMQCDTEQVDGESLMTELLMVSQ